MGWRVPTCSTGRTRRIDPATIQIELTIAAQEPERVDLDGVAAELPYGQVTAKAVHGGLNVADLAGDGQTIIVNAGIVVRLPL
ncbi:MAG: Lin0512 family protein [Pseudomonadota bacterium]